MQYLHLYSKHLLKTNFCEFTFYVMLCFFCINILIFVVRKINLSIKLLYTYICKKMKNVLYMLYMASKQYIAQAIYIYIY